MTLSKHFLPKSGGHPHKQITIWGYHSQIGNTTDIGNKQEAERLGHVTIVFLVEVTLFALVLREGNWN